MESRPHLYEGDRHLPHDWDIHKLMYEIPGFGEPNIERYINSRKQNKKELERITMNSRFETTGTDGRIEILRRALSSPDLELQKNAAELVQYIESDEQAALQNLLDQNAIHALASESADERKAGAIMAQYASETIADKILKSTTSAIDEYLTSEDAAIQKVGAQMIGTLQDYGERRKYQGVLAEHVQQQISSEDSSKQMDAVQIMRYVPSDRLPPLISSVLDGKNTEVKIVTAQYIKRLRPQVAASLLRQLLKSGNTQLEQIAAEATTKLFRIHDKQPEIPLDIVTAISDIASRSLSEDDLEAQRAGAAMLKDVSDMDKLPRLINLGMKSKDTQVRVLSVKAIRFLSENTEAEREDIIKLFMTALQSDDYEVQKTAVLVARHIPEPEKTKCMESAFELVKKFIQSPVQEDRKHGAEMAYYVTHSKMGELFEIIEQDSELLETLMFSRLYPDDATKSVQKDNRTFHQRVKFDKTGSEMTLLRRGSLERKLLVRHINKSAFLGWMRAFEENDTWLENDFDYVPVEPIQSFTIRETKVDVYAGVFDIDLKHWISVSGGRFEDELKNKRQQVISVLQNLGIRHSDLHEGNFFLKFPRREDDTIDTQTCPRIYVGDFDKSRLKTKLKPKKK